MSEYPRMLYKCAKPGEGTDVCENFHVHMQIVDDEEGEAKALDDGWRTGPKPTEKPKKAA